MKSEIDLHRDIVEELAFDPRVDASNIGVAVHDGIVTLTGSVPSFIQKYDAEKAVKRVSGVQGIANDLEVVLPGSSERTDTDIARAALDAIRWNISLPQNIQVIVRNGLVTLTGEVEWQWQKDEAEATVRWLTGVKGVTNLITVQPHVTPRDVKQTIEREFERLAETDAKNIQVETRDGSVTLRGKVHSFNEITEAVRAAWSVPGVKQVENRLSLTV